MEESKRCKNRSKIWSVLGWGAVVIALLCMLGLVVSLIVLGLKDDAVGLCVILCCSFAGGTVVFAPVALLLMRRAEHWRNCAVDAMERADNEESFSVAEDVFVTFGEEGLRIHGMGLNNVVPYDAMRYYSVCSRMRPSERGAWSVLFGVPAGYMTKHPMPGGPSVLIQTAGKERLYACLEKHGISLEGELPPKQKVKKRYTRIKQFVLPLPKKRTRGILFLLFGAAAIGSGTALTVFYPTIGPIVIFLGLYLFLRGILALRNARRTIVVYKEGLFFGEPELGQSSFIKWDNIVRMRPAGENGENLRVKCYYGVYEFPCPQGAYEYLQANYAEKCKEKDKEKEQK